MFVLGLLLIWAYILTNIQNKSLLKVNKRIFIGISKINKTKIFANGNNKDF